jgi:hypothetical protein
MTIGSNFVRWEAPALAKQEDSEGKQEAPRRGAASDVEIVLPGRGLQYTGQIVDLSVQGCRVRTKCRLEDGTAVEIWFRTDEMPLRLAARLIKKSETGVQFQFQPIPLRKQEQLEILRLELGLGDPVPDADRA